MNAPLSRYLTQFSAPPLPRVAEISTPFEPRISLTAEELEVRLESAAAVARSEAELRLTSEIDSQMAEKETAAARALEAARSDWVSSQADFLTKHITEAISGLREMIAERLAQVLRPIVTDGFVNRSIRELAEALETILDDADRPALSISGPADLIEALRQRCDAARIEWVVTDSCEVVVLADIARLETCLAPALTSIAATES